MCSIATLIPAVAGHSHGLCPNALFFVSVVPVLLHWTRSRRIVSKLTRERLRLSECYEAECYPNSFSCYRTDKEDNLQFMFEP